MQPNRYLAALLGLTLLLTITGHQAHGQGQKPTSMEDFTYPFTTQKVAVSDSVIIAYADEGQGEQTLLFIHGLGSYLPAWRKNMEVLSDNYRCIALDLPGYGKSSRGDYAFDMTFFATQVAAFIDQLSLKKVTLVGHSMGGQIAMTLALQHPEVIDRLVLIAPAGFETFTEQEVAWFKQIYTPAVVKATPVEQIERNFALNFHEANFPDDARFMYQDRLLMRDTGEEYEAYCRMIPQCVQGMLAEPVYNRLPEIEHPTLVLYGKGDLLIPNTILHAGLTTEKVAQNGHERLPHSTLQLLDACGHFVQWECATAVNEAITTFITNE